MMHNDDNVLNGVGRGRGSDRAAEAAHNAVFSLFLKASLSRVRAMQLNVTAGDDLRLGEVADIVQSVSEATGVNSANLVWSLTHDPIMRDEIRVTIVPTSFE